MLRQLRSTWARSVNGGKLGMSPFHTLDVAAGSSVAIISNYGRLENVHFTVYPPPSSVQLMRSLSSSSSSSSSSGRVEERIKIKKGDKRKTQHSSSPASISTEWIPPPNSPLFLDDMLNEDGEIVLTPEQEKFLDEQQGITIDLNKIDMKDLKEVSGIKDDGNSTFGDIMNVTDPSDEEIEKIFSSANFEFEDESDNDDEIFRKLERLAAMSNTEDVDEIEVHNELDDEEIARMRQSDKNDEMSLLQRIEEIEKQMESRRGNAAVKGEDDEVFLLHPAALTSSSPELEKEKIVELDDGISKTTHVSRPTLLARKQPHPSAVIDIKPNVLLTSKEIMDCLSALGAENVHPIKNRRVKEKLLCMNGDDDVEGGMILATGRTPSHIRVMSNTIVSALKSRKLNVVAAKEGVEEGDDWTSIDAGNYVIHLMDENIRESLNLEAIWDDDPLRADNEFRNLDCDDEEAVENYVRDNPVPDAYARSFYEQYQYGNANREIVNLNQYKFKAFEDQMKRKRKLKRKVKRR